MNMFRRMTWALAAVITSCLFIGLLAGRSAHANESAAVGKSGELCREEVWSVRVLGKGSNPKSTLLPRYHKRTVLVCDEKVFAEMQRRVSSGESESRTNEGA